MSSEGLSIEDKEQHQSYIWNRVGKWRNRWKIKFLIYMDLFQVPILTASSWSIFVKRYVQKDDPDSTGFVYFSQIFYQYVILREPKYIHRNENLEEDGVSTFRSLCAKIFQRCNIMYIVQTTPTQYRSLLHSHQQVADNAHFIHIFNFFSPVLLQLRTFKVSQ